MLEMKKHIQYFGQETSWEDIIVTFRNNGNSSKAGLRHTVNPYPANVENRVSS